MDSVRTVDLPPAVATALRAAGRDSRPGAAQALSERYRAGAASAEGHVVRTAAELAAYATVRFPATYAAAVAACSEIATADPEFAPESLLDVGSGLGATACAAFTVWPSLTTVTCVEPDTRAVTAGRPVVAAATGTAEAPGVTTVEWVTDGFRAVAGRRADLVTAGYVGNELTDPVGFGTALWASTAQVLLLLEPGTHASYRGVLAARDALLADGATTLAPCPHDDRCPLPRSDWCHFGQRLPRTAAHRQAKGGDQPYEDEKYSYVAMTRRPPAATRAGRVLRRPVRRKGLVELRVCLPAGTAGPVRVPRSAPDYRAAKDVGWGDTWPSSSA